MEPIIDVSLMLFLVTVFFILSVTVPNGILFAMPILTIALLQALQFFFTYKDYLSGKRKINPK